MPLKLLLDENLRHESIWSAILNRNLTSKLTLDVVRGGDEGMPALSTTDDELLAWAANNDRILVSLDERSLPVELKRRREAGQNSPGVIFLRKQLGTMEVVDLFELITYATEPAEWADTCRWQP